MVLGLTKSYTPTAGDVSNATSYNTDMAALFNAMSGLEAQTSTLGGLTITPSANSTTKFRVNNAAGEAIVTVDVTNEDIILADAGKLYLDGSTAGAGGDTYITEGAANIIRFYAAGDFVGYITSSWWTKGGISIVTDQDANLISNASTGAGSTTLYIGNASINVTSDKRLKTDIVDSSINALDIVNKFHVVDFTWNDPLDKAPVNRNSRGRWTGLLAQETIDVLPFVVNAEARECSVCKAGNICDEHKTYWHIEHEHIVPVLIKAIQELLARVRDLEVR